MTPFINRLARFRKSEKGSATVEFAIIFPFFMLLLTSAFELGVINLRQVALDSRLDVAMREVRINTGTNYTHDDIKEMICSDAPILANCETHLRLEMVPRIVRACFIFNPILPTSYLSADRISKQDGSSNNLAALTSISAFTQEPR